MEKEKVLVVGTGKSGIAATQLLLRTGKMPVLFDSNAELDKDEILGKLSLSGDEKKQVEIVLGDLTEEEKKELSGVVLSPGVPTDTEFVNDLRNRGLLISGEIELAFEQEKGAVLAITGTNGKTTTTTLLGEIMKATGKKTFVVGNIGNPYTLEAEKDRCRFCYGCGDLFLPAGNDTYLPSACQFDLKYHTGSSEQTSYDGKLCEGKAGYYKESDKGRLLRVKCRGSLYRRFSGAMSGDGYSVLFPKRAGRRLFLCG